MNENKFNCQNRLSENCSELSPTNASVPTNNSPIIEDVQSPTQTTYEIFLWLLFYAKMFVTRLGRDLFQSVKHYFSTEQVLPDHIVDLMKVQSELCRERETRPATYSSSREYSLISGLSCSIRNFFKAFKSYILCSEDDIGLRNSLSKQHTEISGIDKEPMFVLVDSSGISNPSSKELLIKDNVELRDSILRKYFNKYIKTTELPSTSRELSIPPHRMKESESKEEVQMVDINLQSDNDIEFDESEIESESIVLAYLRNKSIILEYEGTLLTSKKKSSLLENVPKMETILEGEQFSAFPLSNIRLSPLSQCSLDEVKKE